MANEINKNYLEDQYINRYKHAKSLVEGLLCDLDIQDLFPKKIEATGVYLNKIYGFNCALEGHLKRIETSKNLWIYRSNLISFLVGLKYIKKSRISEINSNSFKNYNLYSSKIEILFVASLENYAMALLTYARSINHKGKKIVFFLPIEAKSWDIFQKIKKEFDVIFPSNIGLNNKEFIILENKYKKNIKKKLSKIDKNKFLYRNISYYKIAIKSISAFFIEFVPANIVFLNAIYKFFKNSPPFELFIARDRRSIENSFVQVLGALGTKTNMIIHGVITSNYNYSQLFTSHYQYVDNVHIWGNQQLFAIKKKQEALNQRMPKIIKNNVKFKEGEEFKKMNKNLIVIIGQKTNDKALFHLSKNINDIVDGSKFKVVFRPHPNSQLIFKNYKNLQISQRSDYVKTLFPMTSLVITHSSTALLEGISYGSGCLILDYKKFNKVFPSIYREESNFLNKNKFIFSTNEEETLLLIRKYLTSENFIKKNHKYSKSLYSWFVG